MLSLWLVDSSLDSFFSTQCFSSGINTYKDDGTLYYLSKETTERSPPSGLNQSISAPAETESAETVQYVKDNVEEAAQLVVASSKVQPFSSYNVTLSYPSSRVNFALTTESVRAYAGGESNSRPPP